MITLLWLRVRRIISQLRGNWMTLERIPTCPMLFIEYAVGLEPGDFTRFFSAIPDLDRISACIDIGHVGIRMTRANYARNRGGDDICALKSQDPQPLPEVMADVETAVGAGAAVCLDLVEKSRH